MCVCVCAFVIEILNALESSHVWTNHLCGRWFEIFIQVNRINSTKKTIYSVVCCYIARPFVPTNNSTHLNYRYMRQRNFIILFVGPCLIFMHLHLDFHVCFASFQLRINWGPIQFNIDNIYIVRPMHPHYWRVLETSYCRAKDGDVNMNQFLVVWNYDCLKGNDQTKGNIFFKAVYLFCGYFSKQLEYYK